jgi:hypothetical protein
VRQARETCDRRACEPADVGGEAGKAARESDTAARKMDTVAREGESVMNLVAKPHKREPRCRVSETDANLSLTGGRMSRWKPRWSESTSG